MKKALITTTLITFLLVLTGCGSPMTVCPEEGSAVCGLVDVQCVTQPCPPIEETFANHCVAEKLANAYKITEGECTPLFGERLWTIAEERTGLIPIEGHEEGTLRGTFPALTVEDFDGIETIGGILTLAEGELEYTSTRTENYVTSADQSISTRGYETLLKHLKTRYNTDDMEEVIRQLTAITDFESCAAAGNNIMESYPRQCAHEGTTYVEEVEAIIADIPEAIVPTLINGKTTDTRLQEAYQQLHTVGSAEQIRNNFPDIKLVYSDNPLDRYPAQILPFDYYYSEEANKTFNLCAIHRTVFICDGKLDHAITDEEMNSEKCRVTPVYAEYQP